MPSLQAREEGTDRLLDGYNLTVRTGKAIVLQESSVCSLLHLFL
jgi:hypothetical protein